MRRFKLGFTVVLAFVLGCGGSGGRRTAVTQYPQWKFDKYERIAVLPVQVKDPRARREAGTVTNRLTDLLTSNGAFNVISRAELKDVLTEQDLSRLADVADPRTVLPEGRIQAAQALVIGYITDYDLAADRAMKRVPRFARDRAGRPVRGPDGRLIVTGEEMVPIYRHSATLSGGVRIIDTVTGEILLSYGLPQPIKAEQESEGRPPANTPEDLAAQAARDLAQDFYRRIAPVAIRIKLDKDVLIVATDYYDGQYDVSDKLPTSYEEFLLAVRNLPPECNRNPFRVAIAEAEGRANLFEKEFIWSDSLGRRGAQFTVPMAALSNAGGTNFVAKLYSGADEQPILTRKFRLETPKAEKNGREEKKRDREVEQERKKEDKKQKREKEEKDD